MPTPPCRHLAVWAGRAGLEVQGQVVHTAAALLVGRAATATGQRRCRHGVLLQWEEKYLSRLRERLDLRLEQPLLEEAVPGPQSAYPEAVICCRVTSTLSHPRHGAGAGLWMWAFSV